jgi:hypothetical protein
MKDTVMRKKLGTNDLICYTIIVLSFISLNCAVVSGGASIDDRKTFNEISSVFVAPASTNCSEMMKEYPTDDTTFSPASFTLLELKNYFRLNFIQSDPKLVFEKERQRFSLNEEDAVKLAQPAPADAVLYIWLSIASVYDIPSAWIKIKFLDTRTGKELARCSFNTQYSAFGSTKIDGVSMEAIRAAIENLKKELQPGE